MKGYALLWFILLVMAGCQTMPNTRSDLTGVNVNHKAADINMRLGLEYMKNGDYVIALEKLARSLKQNPRLPATHNTIALLYQILGEMDKAEYHFKLSVKYGPGYSEAQNNFGVFLCQQGRYREAEKHFLLAAENPLYVSMAEAIENAGKCVSKIPDLDAASAHFLRALRIDPQMTESLFNLAKLNYQQENFSIAKSYIDSYRAASPWTVNALLLAIKIADALGDKDRATSYILLLKARFPDAPETAEMTQRLN